MTFFAFYWELDDLADAALREAALALADWRQPQRRDAAFGFLLQSDSIPAQGVAMDTYARSEMDGRWGLSNPFEAYRRDVRRRAREQLANPPYWIKRGEHWTAANHASALGALLNLAEADDAPLIARVLANNPDANVLDTGLHAARHALADSEREADESLIDVLAAIAGNQALDPCDRADALRALASGGTPRCSALLIAALDDANVRVQATAAWMLSDTLELYGDRLRALVESWPPDAPYPASEVRDALDDYDADQARRVVQR